METWEPATLEEVSRFLAKGLDVCHPAHRARFEEIRVIPRLVPVADFPGEFVYLVAEHGGKLLYYSDVEEGWEIEPPNEHGGINTRGCNQFELTHVMYQIFGNPDKAA
jgi:hypothetical protein